MPGYIWNAITYTLTLKGVPTMERGGSRRQLMADIGADRLDFLPKGRRDARRLLAQHRGHGDRFDDFGAYGRRQTSILGER